MVVNKYFLLEFSKITKEAMLLFSTNGVGGQWGWEEGNGGGGDGNGVGRRQWVWEEGNGGGKKAMGVVE